MQISDSLSHTSKLFTWYRLYLRARVLPKERFVAELKAIATAVENYLKYVQLAVDHPLASDYLKVAPFFAFLHNDPRFINILRQYN